MTDLKTKIHSFHHVLVNTLFTSVMDFTVWFAITFYVYLQTRSVFATGLIAGIYLLTTMFTGIWFGSLVDHYKKKTMMFISNAASLVFYLLSFVVYLSVPHSEFTYAGSVWLWVFVTLLIFGVIIGNIRTIIMPTLVTLLIPADRRDKFNGLVGTASGISFLVTSVISGFLVAFGGMLYVLILALVTIAVSSLHLLTVSIPEKKAKHADDSPKKVDLKATIALVVGVPGLIALIFFSTFNNLLGGVYMALMDAYGLSLVSVEMWGLLWGAISTAYIIGGILIARRGLGKNPLRTLMIVNLVLWVVCITFPIQSSIIPLAIGMFMYMLIVPFAEASEQTILQKVVPYQRQGRVFGFAQSVEQAASPLSAFLIAPLAEFFFIPLMTNGAGAQAIGSWFGTGAIRGLALVFIVAGLIGLVVTIVAFMSVYYRRLSERYLSTNE